MTTKEQIPLFEKTPEELREAFVRNRFGEKQVFGRPDIAEWIAGSHDPADEDYDPKPWDAVAFYTMWTELFSKVSADFCQTLINQDRLTPLNQGDVYARMKMGHVTVPLNILSVLLSGKKNAFFGMQSQTREQGRDSLIFVSCEGDTEVIVLERPASEITFPSALFSPITSIDVLRALMYEFMHQRDGAARALEDLIAAYKLTIQEVRERAEVDFESAVAVSADGKKIVNAERVIIQRGIYFEGVLRDFDYFECEIGLCRKQKILRPETILRARDYLFEDIKKKKIFSKSDGHGETLKDFVRRVTSSYAEKCAKHGAILIRAKCSDGEMPILVVDSSLCPPEVLVNV